MPEPQHFSDAEAFHAWFLEHHRTEAELWVQFYKVGSGTASQTWPDAVDVALCFGWIDGHRKSIDAQSYKVRFTPRKPGSVWSAVNVAKVEALIRTDRMRPEGLLLFESRKDTVGYSSKTREMDLDPALQSVFEADAAAWAGFGALSPAYRRDAIWWVMSAKRPETRRKRIGVLIECSRAGQRVPALGGKPPTTPG